MSSVEVAAWAALIVYALAAYNFRRAWRERRRTERLLAMMIDQRAALAEGMVLWQYGAHGEAIEVIRDAGIRVGTA